MMRVHLSPGLRQGPPSSGRRWTTAAIIAILALVLAACGEGSAPGDPARSDGGEHVNDLEVAVVRDDPGLPPECRPAALAATITDLLEALNRGDRTALDQAFAPKGRFGVYSAPRDPLDVETPSDELVMAIRDRSTLVPRILDARSEGDLLRLRAVEGACAFGFYLGAERAGHPSTLMAGKGELDPRTGQFEVFVVSNPALPDPDRDRMCGERLEPAGPVVACSGVAKG
jgi:hypothetical protein